MTTPPESPAALFTDPTCIWVDRDAALTGEGTFESPCASIADALSLARPGSTIMLKQGDYSENLSVHISGELQFPLRITAHSPQTTRIVNSEWYFYDASDWIVSNLTFVQSTHHAIACVGNNSRNSFVECRFLECGDNASSAATLFFAGSAATSIMIDRCTFARSGSPKKQTHGPIDKNIAVLISDGGSGNDPNTHWIIRNSSFQGYDHAIVAGSSDIVDGEFGHIIHNNFFSKIYLDAIIAKCGDTTIVQNTFTDCAETAITITAALACTIAENKFLECKHGVSVFGQGHSLANNAFIRCTMAPISLPQPESPFVKPACNVLIEHNTFIACGTLETPAVCGIHAARPASAIISDNIIVGNGLPFYLTPDATGVSESKKVKHIFIMDNRIDGGCLEQEGFTSLPTSFQHSAENNFEHPDLVGAHGFSVDPAWAPEPEAEKMPEIEDDEAGILGDIEALESEHAQEFAAGTEDDDSDDYDTDTLLAKSLMLVGEDPENSEEELLEESPENPEV